MIVVGIDLAGPNNLLGTDFVAFREEGPRLRFLSHIAAPSDALIRDEVCEYAIDDDVVVGLDAPLSYSQDRGDRAADKALRRRLTDMGAPPGCVMAPTAPRMVYLTLRGVVVARELTAIEPCAPRLVEVHPSGALVLRGAPVAAVRSMKSSADARVELGQWLITQGVESFLLREPTADGGLTDHHLASCACALAAWDWFRGRARWIERARAPHHPFDFAC